MRYITNLGSCEIIETYVFYDEPVLFSCRNESGQLYLGVFSDETQDNETWLYARVSIDRLKQIRTGEIDLYTALTEPEDGLLLMEVIAYSDEAECVMMIVQPNVIPKDILPIQGNRLDLDSDTFPITEWLSDHGNLTNYLQVSIDKYLHDGDTNFFLHEIKKVVEALGGTSGISEQANVNLKFLSDDIYKGVMPPFRILNAMFRALGLDSSMSMGLARRRSSETILMEDPDILMSFARPEEQSEQSTTDILTERQRQNKKYWGHIRNHLDWIDNNIICPEPNKSNFQDLRIKGTGCALRARQTVRPKEISAAFVIRGKKSTGYFYSLRIEQREIEQEFSDKLEWVSDEKSYKQIGCRNREMDPADETDWYNQHRWLSNTLEKLYTVLQPRIEMVKNEF